MRYYTSEDDNAIRRLRAEHSYKEIGAIMGRSEASVRNRCWRLKLPRRRKLWTTEEKEILISWCDKHNGFYYGQEINDLANKFGRNVGAVQNKITQYGLGSRVRVSREGRKDNRIFKCNIKALRKFQSQRMKDFIKSLRQALRGR